MNILELVEREREHVEFGPFHRAWLLQKAPHKVHRSLDLAGRGFMGARQSFASDSLDPNSASFTAIASSTTETNVTNVAGGAAQYAGIPAGDARAGRIYRVAFGGIISNTATPTVIWTPRWGQSDTSTSNTTLGASPTITTVASLSNHPVFGEFELTFRSVGVGAGTGTATGNGMVAWGNASATASVAVMGSSVPTTLATTAAAGLMVSLTWGTNSASNTFTCQWFHLSSLN